MPTLAGSVRRRFPAGSALAGACLLGSCLLAGAGATTAASGGRSAAGSAAATAPAGTPPGRPLVSGTGLPSGNLVAPSRPAAMAVGPSSDLDGALYVLDYGRDEILRELPLGHFAVVAGTGRRGFTGDAGRAIAAKIAVSQESGMAVSPGGTLYFADSANGRLREVLPDGTIRTVAGGGRTPLSTRPVRALDAALPKPFGLDGIAFGPDGDLYLSAGGVYRLTPGGMLEWVVGTASRAGGGIYANPASQADFTRAASLAFDGAGDLLVAGGPGTGLYERTAGGRLRFVEKLGDRSGTYRGSLASAPSGDVVLAAGASTPALFSPSGKVSSLAAPGLAHLLGGHDVFALGAGVAAAPNGEIYVDTDATNGSASVSAIASIHPGGRVHLVWES